MASASTTFTPPNIAQLISTKLDGFNYLNWISQFTPVLRSNDLLGFVDGSEPCPEKLLPSKDEKESDVVNPEYLLWIKKDQFVLSWLNATLESSVLSHGYGMNTARELWNALAKRYANPSRSRINHLKSQLQNLQQAGKSCADLLSTAKVLAAQLAAVGKSVDDDDMISYVNNGLNSTFHPFIVSVSFALRNSSMTFVDYESELLSYEILMEGQNPSEKTQQPTFAMIARTLSNYKRPRPNNYRPKSFPQTRNQPSQLYPSQKANPSSSIRPNTTTFTSAKTPCQICGKTNHAALDCFHRMDYSYQGRHPPPQLAAMVAQSNTMHEENTWIADSGANTHITNNLSNLTIQEPYPGDDSVAMGNGSQNGNHATGGVE